MHVRIVGEVANAARAQQFNQFLAEIVAFVLSLVASDPYGANKVIVHFETAALETRQRTKIVLLGVTEGCDTHHLELAI